ncbi:uncharacterized protein LOC126905492 isoform X2 [Daktulosphaira vitifoliae]|uniref:uncharacterized protein LOC126905492 isoform X2 n=1 Tax=Daktulosphaira vitifoliae TaxID=58002 RepID=UPI0021AA70AC|nr:uncharacterized protein LOC126905492 isoform X2 [Daktulosphaira vitifoliae]
MQDISKHWSYRVIVTLQDYNHLLSSDEIINNLERYESGVDIFQKCVIKIGINSNVIDTTNQKFTSQFYLFLKKETLKFIRGEGNITFSKNVLNEIGGENSKCKEKSLNECFKNFFSKVFNTDEVLSENTDFLNKIRKICCLKGSKLN